MAQGRNSRSHGFAIQSRPPMPCMIEWLCKCEAAPIQVVQEIFVQGVTTNRLDKLCFAHDAFKINDKLSNLQLRKYGGLKAERRYRQRSSLVESNLRVEKGRRRVSLTNHDSIPFCWSGSSAEKIRCSLNCNGFNEKSAL